MSFQMFKDGYHNITNIDLSPSAIEMMKFQQEKKQMKMECELDCLIGRDCDGRLEHDLRG